MYLYLFEVNGKIEFVDEKTAHNYLRHPTGSQRAILKYLGVIKEQERTLMLSEIKKEVFEKFGKIGQSESDDARILESRQFTEERFAEKMKDLKPDRSVMPRHLDYTVTNGISGQTKDVSSLKEAIQALR